MKRSLFGLVACLLVVIGFSAAFADSCSVVNHTVWSSTTEIKFNPCF